MDNITTNRLVYDKKQYERVINTSFTQLIIPTTISASLPTISIDEFFQYYQELFFQIPKLGNTNSHEYLIKTSGEYVGSTDNNNSLIQALIDETTQLRQENLDLQNQITSGSTIS